MTTEQTHMATDSERPIVITGGSIEVDFSDTFDQVTAALQGTKKFKQRDGNKKITTITVVINGGTPQTFNVQNGKCEIRVDYR